MRYRIEWRSEHGTVTLRGSTLIEAPSGLRAETGFLHASDAAGLTGRRCTRTTPEPLTPIPAAERYQTDAAFHARVWEIALTACAPRGHGENGAIPPCPACIDAAIAVIGAP